MNDMQADVSDGYKMTELGVLPSDWKTEILGEVTETFSGGTPNRKNSEYWSDGSIPWAKSGELRDSRIYLVEERITPKALDETSVKMVSVGTLLLAMYGATAGKVGIAEIETAINQAICAIQPAQDQYMNQ